MPDEIEVLDEQETRAWRALLRANATLVNKLDRALEVRHNLGLPDYEVLTHLSSAKDNSLRMTELARDVLLSPSGLTRRLDGLVKTGYVQRQPCPSDGRGLLAVITDKGRDKLKEMAPTHVNTIREHFVNCVSRTQLEGLIDVLEQVADYGQSCPPESMEADLRDDREKQPATTG